MWIDVLVSRERHVPAGTTREGLDAEPQAFTESRCSRLEVQRRTVHMIDPHRTDRRAAQDWKRSRRAVWHFDRSNASPLRRRRDDPHERDASLAKVAIVVRVEGLCHRLAGWSATNARRSSRFIRLAYCFADQWRSWVSSRHGLGMVTA